MTALVIAEHDNASIKPATLNTVTAAAQCGGEVHVLVAGLNAGAAAQAASQMAGVSRVIHVEGVHFEHGLAENMAAQVLALASAYSHILFPATASGKNIAPRVAATMDVGQISDITKVESSDTFERPIYAGNAIATVQSMDATKVITASKISVAHVRPPCVVALTRRSVRLDQGVVPSVCLALCGETGATQRRRPRHVAPPRWWSSPLGDLRS